MKHQLHASKTGQLPKLVETSPMISGKMKGDLAIHQEIKSYMIKTSLEHAHMKRLVALSATVPIKSACACCGSSTIAIPSVLDRIATRKERLNLCSAMITTARNRYDADYHILTLEFLRNLSRWGANKLLIFSSSNTMCYLMECINEFSTSREFVDDQAFHTRHLALMVLNNVAICPRVAVGMAQDTSLILLLQGILDTVSSSVENQDCCTVCLNILSNIAVWDFGADALLILHPQVLSRIIQMVLTLPVQSMSEALQVGGFRFIAALTVHAHYRAVLARFPLLLSAVLKCAQKGSLYANNARRLALRSLANLALEPENSSLLFASEFFISMLVQIIDESCFNSVEVREQAIQVLINLTLWSDNRMRLFNDQQVMTAISNVIVSHTNNTISIRQLAIRVLVGIAAEPGVRHAIYMDQNLLNIIMDNFEQENDSEIQEHAAVFLVFLSYCEENRIMMLENNRLFRHFLEWATFDCIPEPFRVHTLVALESLALNPKNKQKLLANRPLLNALMQIAVDRTQLMQGVKSELLSATEELLGCLGIWRKQVEFNQVIVILCSVRDIPRLDVSNPPFQMIPKDLIRVLAEFVRPD